VKVVGDFAFTESQLRIPSVPLLTKVTGKVTFTEQDVRAATSPPKFSVARPSSR
jgi:hypothetical protein